MRHLLLPALVVAIAVPLSAQLKTVSSPPGFETMEQADSAGWGYRLGQYQNERFQAADGQFRKQLLIISEISYRLDAGRNYGTGTSGGGGRSWTRVTLHMAECDYDQVTNTFSTNVLTTPQKVFDAKMTWQAQVGVPSGNPVAWGSHGHKFPFSSGWVYSGSKDILLDYVFVGGTLANSAAWSGSTSKRYYLDGFNAPNFNLGGQTEYPGGGTQAASYAKTSPPYCMDSALSVSTQAARNDIQGIYVYNADRQSNPNQVYLSWRSFYTAPGAQVIKALGFAGIPAGVNLAAKCNLLYLDAKLPLLLFPDTASATASTAASGFTTLSAKFQSSMGGASLWFQCAWNDSKTKFFALTTATQRTVPLSAPPLGPRRQTVYASDPTAVTGSGPYKNGDNAGYGANPMYLITHK